MILRTKHRFYGSTLSIMLLWRYASAVRCVLYRIVLTNAFHRVCTDFLVHLVKWHADKIVASYRRGIAYIVKTEVNNVSHYCTTSTLAVLGSASAKMYCLLFQKYTAAKVSTEPSSLVMRTVNSFVSAM